MEDITSFFYTKYLISSVKSKCLKIIKVNDGDSFDTIDMYSNSLMTDLSKLTEDECYLDFESNQHLNECIQLMDDAYTNMKDIPDELINTVIDYVCMNDLFYDDETTFYRIIDTIYDVYKLLDEHDIKITRKNNGIISHGRYNIVIEIHLSNRTESVLLRFLYNHHIKLYFNTTIAEQKELYDSIRSDLKEYLIPTYYKSNIDTDFIWYIVPIAKPVSNISDFNLPTLKDNISYTDKSFSNIMMYNGKLVIVDLEFRIN